MPLSQTERAEARRALRLKITHISMVVCLSVAVANVYEGSANKDPFKFGMAGVMMMNLMLFASSLVAARRREHDASTSFFLAGGPTTILGVFVFESPSIAFVTTTAVTALLMFLPDVLAPKFVSHSRWLSILAGAGIVGVVTRLLWRGVDFVDSTPELFVIILGPVSLLVMLWLAVQSILDQLVEALDESEALQGELVARNDALARASASKSRFLANMSHELRTPLNAIIGYAEIISEELEDDGQTDRPWFHDVDKVRVAGHHLLGLISDVLDLSKIEAGRMSVDAVSLSLPELCSELVQTCEPLASAKGNTLELELDGAVDVLVTDRTKLRQILLNLVSNAAKFTLNGQLHLRVMAKGEERVRFEVEDTGIGIDEAKLESLFQAFVQADASTTREYGGTGLGLALVKELSGLLGGEVGVESQPGVGSCFWVELPRIYQPPRAPGARAKYDSGAFSGIGGDRVVIVDDDPSTLELFERHLAKQSWSVESYTDGREALDALRLAPASVVVLDIMMPGIDGWQLLDELHELEGAQETSTVVISIMDESERALSRGADAFLLKPVSKSVLVETLARISAE